ncbi:MAG: hypothetical protein WCP45_16055 [Verrucomicrobiota bacterium]
MEYALKAARKILTRIHFERLKLPVLTHVAKAVIKTTCGSLGRSPAT